MSTRRRESRDDEREAAEAPAVREAEDHAGEEDRVRRLDRDRRAGGEAAASASTRVEPPDDCEARSTRDTSTATIEGKSAIAGEPERLRERQLRVPLVVEVIRVLDADERHREPEQRHPVAEEPPADLLRDAVHAEQRDRREHDDVEQHDRRQRRSETRAGERRDRREQTRPVRARRARAELARARAASRSCSTRAGRRPGSRASRCGARSARAPSVVSHWTPIAGTSSVAGRTFSSQARARGSVSQARRPASTATVVIRPPPRRGDGS